MNQQKIITNSVVPLSFTDTTDVAEKRDRKADIVTTEIFSIFQLIVVSGL